MDETELVDLDRILSDLYGPVRTDDEAGDTYSVVPDEAEDPEPEQKAEDDAQEGDTADAGLEKVYAMWNKATYGA